MLNIPQRIHAIQHPLVDEAYLKKEFSQDPRGEDVLVIETSIHDDDNHDAYLSTFISDLSDLKHQAEQQIGYFDRIDIRIH